MENWNFIKYKGYTYYYEYRNAKHKEDICLATKDPNLYCNGFYLYSDKDVGNGKAFVVTHHNNPSMDWMKNCDTKIYYIEHCWSWIDGTETESVICLPYEIDTNFDYQVSLKSSEIHERASIEIQQFNELDEETSFNIILPEHRYQDFDGYHFYTYTLIDTKYVNKIANEIFDKIKWFNDLGSTVNLNKEIDWNSIR